MNAFKNCSFIKVENNHFSFFVVWRAMVMVNCCWWRQSYRYSYRTVFDSVFKNFIEFFSSILVQRRFSFLFIYIFFYLNERYTKAVIAHVYYQNIYNKFRFIIAFRIWKSFHKARSLSEKFIQNYRKIILKHRDANLHFC